MHNRELRRSSSPNSEGTQHKYDRLSPRSTPENPNLHGRMKSSDRTSTSDGSRSGNDNPMLRLIEMTMKEKLDIANKLDKANQKIQELTNQLEQTTQERDKLRNLGIDLTTQLEQANRKNEELTNQLKNARLDGKSPLKRGDSSSKSPEEIEATRKVINEWMLKKINEK